MVHSKCVVLGDCNGPKFLPTDYFRRVAGSGAHVPNLSGPRKMAHPMERDHQAKRGSIATVCIDLLVSSAGEGFFATNDPVELSEDEDCLAFTLCFPRGEGIIALEKRWKGEVGILGVEFQAHQGERCLRCTVSGVRSVYQEFLDRQGGGQKRSTHSIKSLWLLLALIVILSVYWKNG